MLSNSHELMLVQQTSQRFPILRELKKGPAFSKVILQKIEHKQIKLYIQKDGLQNALLNYLMGQNMLHIIQLFHSIADQFLKILYNSGLNLDQLNDDFVTAYLHVSKIMDEKCNIQKIIPFQIKDQPQKGSQPLLRTRFEQLLRWILQQLLTHYEMTTFASAGDIQNQISVRMKNFQKVFVGRFNQISKIVMKKMDQEKEQENTEQLLDSISRAQLQAKSSIIMLDPQYAKVQQVQAELKVTAAKNNSVQLRPYQCGKQKNVTDKKVIQYALTLKLDFNNQLINLHGKFTAKQKQLLEASLKMLKNQWEKSNTLITGHSVLVTRNEKYFSSCLQKLTNAINKIKYCNESQKQNSPKRFAQLAGLLYAALIQQNNNIAPKILRKLCKNIQSSFKFYHLRKIISIYQNSHFQVKSVTQQLKNLYQQRPMRSAQFKQSQQSKLHKLNGFANKKQAQGLIMHNYQNPKNSVKLVRLNYCEKPTKNVIILISGFLSQYSAKDKQWQGIIRAHKNTEIFGLIWPSNSVKDLGKFFALLVAQFGAQYILPRPEFQAVAFQAVRKVINLFTQKKQGQVSNTFFQALKNTESTGKLLAQCLINNFKDRKVTLVGFSMGTEVIYRCIGELAQRKQLQVVQKVVTIGGIAKTDQVKLLLGNGCQVGLSWINFWSRNDWTVRWIFWLISSCSNAIGAEHMESVPGHEIINYEMTNVKGHMDYHNHYGEIYEKAGFKYD